jgi:hypothetical protein
MIGSMRGRLCLYGKMSGMMDTYCYSSGACIRLRQTAVYT